MDLYRKWKEQSISNQEKEEKKSLEKKYPFDDIITWRKLMNAELDYEKKQFDPTLCGFCGRLFGASQETEELPRQELYERIGFDEDKKTSGIPPDFKQIEMHFFFQGGSLTMLDDSKLPIGTASFENLQMDIDIYSECTDLKIELEKIEVVGILPEESVPMLYMEVCFLTQNLISERRDPKFFEIECSS